MSTTNQQPRTHEQEGGEEEDSRTNVTNHSYLIHRHPQQPQPPSEKAGAGILIRTLFKPKHPPTRRRQEISNTESETGPITTTYYDQSPTIGDTVKVHYEAYLYKDSTTTTEVDSNQMHNNQSNRNMNMANISRGNNTASTNHDNKLPVLQDKPFDSSRTRNLPLCFVVGKDEVIEGLDIAVEHMTIGQIVEVTIPYLFAYGEQGYLPQIPPLSTLIFRVELLDFISDDVIHRGRKWQS